MTGTHLPVESKGACENSEGEGKYLFELLLLTPL